MSQQNGFGSGFVFGSLIGGVVGGLLGATLANRGEKQPQVAKSKTVAGGNNISLDSEANIELARHGLEDKIAQLNLAIDDVTQQLGSVQSSSLEHEQQ